MKKIISFLIAVLCLSGCYNYNEMNDLSIISALGIDYEDNLYKLSAQVVEFKNEKETFVTFTSEGNTIYEALRNLSKSSSKKMYISHLEVLLLSEKVYKEKNDEIIDFFANYPESSLNYYVTVTDGSPIDFINTSTPLTTLSSGSIIEMLKLNNKYESFANLITFDEYINDYISQGKSLIVPRIHIKSYSPSETDEKQRIIEIKDLIAVNKNKEITYLNESESIGYSILSNNCEKYILTLPCSGGKFTIELKSSNTKINIKENNMIMIEINAFGTVGSYDCNITDEKEIKKMVVEKTEKEIENYTNKALELSLSKKTDFIGIGNIFYAYNYKYFINIIDEWENKYLEKIKYNIKSNVSVNKLGNLKSTIKGSD